MIRIESFIRFRKFRVYLPLAFPVSVSKTGDLFVLFGKMLAHIREDDIINVVDLSFNARQIVSTENGELCFANDNQYREGNRTTGAIFVYDARAQEHGILPLPYYVNHTHRFGTLLAYDPHQNTIITLGRKGKRWYMAFFNINTWQWSESIFLPESPRLSIWPIKILVGANKIGILAYSKTSISIYTPVFLYIYEKETTRFKKELLISVQTKYLYSNFFDATDNLENIYIYANGEIHHFNLRSKQRSVVLSKDSNLSWLKISPRGKYLICRYGEIYCITDMKNKSRAIQFSIKHPKYILHDGIIFDETDNITEMVAVKAVCDLHLIFERWSKW